MGPEVLSKFIQDHIGHVRHEAPSPSNGGRKLRVIHPQEEREIIKHQHEEVVRHVDLDLEKAHEAHETQIERAKTIVPNTDEFV